ncbi:MAG: HpcH/HpaI aldolase/citrate lyase family protein [Burkholderiaceae bacterium]
MTHDRASHPAYAPSHRLVWLFGAGASQETHEALVASGAQVLIQDLEDFTPPALRPQARSMAPALFRAARAAGSMVCVRINALDQDGLIDLQAVMPHRPDVIAYPKAERALDMAALAEHITRLEQQHGVAVGHTEILPVCETALGVVEVRALAAATPRVRAALLGTEDLATDLQAERGVDGVELDHARRRFLLECRAARIEPVDAPYTFSDVEGAVAEARYSRRLGYQTKSLVNPAMVKAVQAALAPAAADVALAQETVQCFEAARARGEDRALVRGLWVEVPTYLNARRLLERARGLQSQENPR